MPLFHRTATQPFPMGATDKMKGVYRDIALQTQGHFLVGIEPRTFLERFLPWNASTPDTYQQRVPSKRRLTNLRSVPPIPGQVKSAMYQPCVWSPKFNALLMALSGGCTGQVDQSESLARRHGRTSASSPVRTLTTARSFLRGSQCEYHTGDFIIGAPTEY